MAKNDKYGSGDDEFDFDFDDANFDDSDFGDDNSGSRKPKTKLARFQSALRNEALTPNARKKYIRDALPSQYHTSVDAIDSLAEAGADLYNDSITKEWQKSKSSVKKALRANADNLRKFRLGKIADWAESTEDYYGSGEVDADELEIASQMGIFNEGLKGALEQAKARRREEEEAAKLEYEASENRDKAEDDYRETTVKQGNANFGMLSRLLQSSNRLVDYQDQITFNYHKKMIDLGVRSLMLDRRSYEQQTLMRKELNEALTAIAKNTGLPDYVKISSEENAKRVLRDKFVMRASDWAGNKLGTVVSKFIQQTKVNIASGGDKLREFLDTYNEDFVGAGQDAGMSQNDMFSELLYGWLAKTTANKGSEIIGKRIRKMVENNSKLSGMFDTSEAILANGGNFANMAMSGRSGIGLLDKLMEVGGYSSLAQKVRTQIGESNASRLDQAAYLDNSTKRAIVDVIPGWLGRIWQAVYGYAKGVSPDSVPAEKWDHRFNRFRKVSELQDEFNTESFNEEMIHSYNDGMDRWIDSLDPDHTLTPAARNTIRKWLISNHAKGLESFPVALYKGENLPKGTPKEVKQELEQKIPVLAGFNPDKVNASDKVGAALETQIIRENPRYRRKITTLSYIDQESRSRMPVSNEKLEQLTNKFGYEALIGSKLGRYDADGNVHLNTEAIVETLSTGGYKKYHQRNELLDDEGNVREIAPENDTEERVKLQYLNNAKSGTAKDEWAKTILRRMNVPGFAKGGFTSGDPDKIAGVTHGGEAVMNSTATKGNVPILNAINKLSAPLTMAGGKLNRVYYKALGFNSPEEVDKVNEFKSKGLKDDILDGNFQGNKVLEHAKQSIKDRIKNRINQHWYQDGYDSSMGPVPEFMGPIRHGGLKNNLNRAGQSIINYVNETDQMGNRFNALHRKQQAKNLMEDTKHRILNHDYKGSYTAGRDKLAYYKSRAQEALRRANQSSTLDFDATKNAIDKTIAEGGYAHEEEAKSLYLQGMRSPFITKHDFATGRFRNRLNGNVITKLADIMDDIVLVDDKGNATTVATMADMLEGVYDGRGNKVRLIGLEEGHRKYLKKTTTASRAIKNSFIGKFALAVKDKVWDDHPVDVCIIQGGNLTLVLKASGFVAGLYLDKETKDVLKSHNDIRGEVVDLNGETKLTLDELASGIFGTDGKKLHISKIKHLRNKMVTAIETKVGNFYTKQKNKLLDRSLSFLEGKQNNQVYVKRYFGNGDYRITPAFTLDDLKKGNLRGVQSGKTFTSLSEINEPVYSLVTKSVVVKADELEAGFMDKNGNPFKDFKNMSLDDRIQHQQDKAINLVTAKFKSAVTKFTDGWNEARGNVDVYVKGEPVARLLATDIKAGVYSTVIKYQDGAETKFDVKPISSYRDIAGAVVKNPTNEGESRITVITEEELQKGLVDSRGKELVTSYVKQTNKVQGKIASFFSKALSKLKIKAMVNLYLKSDMSTPILTAAKLNGGKIINLKTRKVVTSYSDLKGGVTDSEDESIIVSDSQISDLVFEDGSPVPFSKALGGRLKTIGSSVFSKLKGMRIGSWQWQRAKKEEEARNKKQDINVNVDNGGKKKEGFLAKLLGGLGGMLGTLFGTAFLKLRGMFKSIRNAIMISKAATGIGGALANGGGRGKLGLATKLIGAGLIGYGGYKAYNAFGGEGEDETQDVLADKNDPTPTEEKAGFLQSVDNATGGFGTEIAATGGLYLAGKGIAKINARRAAARAAGTVARGATGALASGASNAASATSTVARGAGKLGRLALKYGGKAGRIGLKVGGAVNRGIMAVSNPARMLSGAAKLGRFALNVGKVGLGVARFMTGPVGLALTAAVWIGSKLYDNYKNKQNPLMRFRMKQYGFDFDDKEYTTKFLDLENLLKDHVSVDAKGQPTIKESFPEDRVLELFEINPQDPKDQEHTERFITWWVKRFKPVYLSYVKQTYIKMKKTDISLIDDEMSKKDKLELLKGVHFTNKANNPYMIQVSPFKDPEVVNMVLSDVEDAYKTALGFVEDMPDDKKTENSKPKLDADGKPVVDNKLPATPKTWLERTTDGIKEMTKSALGLTKDLAKSTEEVFNKWFDKSSSTIKGLWDGLGKWLTSAVSTLGSKVSNAWETIKSKGLAGATMDAAASVGGAISNGATAVADFATGTYEKITGKAKDNQMMVYKAFVNAGLSPNQAKILTAEVGRENDYQSKYLWGGHVDANNGAQNLGMISWQKGRATALSARLRAKGLIDSNGNMVRSQEALNEQARYLVDEIKNNKEYARTKQVFLSNPNVDYKTGAEVLGRNFIRWDYDGKKINAASHHQKRDKYFAQISGTSLPSGGIISSAAAATVKPVAKPNGKTVVSKAEFDKLSKPAAKPVMGSTDLGTWAKGEQERKSKLATIQAGVLKGTHVIGGDQTDANVTKKPEPSNLDKAKQTAQAKKGSPETTSTDKPASMPSWMQIAWAEEKRGVSEATSASRITQYFTDLGRDDLNGARDSWCAAFVNWCLREAGLPVNTANPVGAKAQSTYGKALPKTNIPYGALVVVAPGHVFFCVGEEGDYVKGLGGNQGNPGRVKVSNFKKDTIIAVRYPDNVTVSNATGPSTSSNVNRSTMAARQANNGTEANLNKLSEPVATPAMSRVGVSQAGAKSQQNQADIQVQSANESVAVFRDQLMESRKQTKLLENIYEAVSGHRSDNLEANKSASDGMSGMSKAQTAQTQMLAGAVDALLNGIKVINSNSNKGSLSDQFPISASK